MQNGRGAQRRSDRAAAVLAALLGFTGCSSKGLPVTGAGGSAAGQGGSGPGDASVDTSNAGDALAGDGATDDSSDRLIAIQVSPATQTVALSAAGSALTGSAMFTATGQFSDGHTEDVTARVGWNSQFASLVVTKGVASVSAPGVYTISVVSGTLVATAQLTATFQGNLFGNGFDPTGQTTLDGTVTGATQIAYPLDHSILPPNLSPVTVHIVRTSGQSAARINFSVDQVVNVNYYAACQPGAGTGCYVDLPLSLTQLFVAVSETKNVAVTARVGGLGASLTESPPINLAWANVPLTGGLYFWTALAPGTIPGYAPPNFVDNSPMPSGSGIERYDFGTTGTATPQLVYSDRGRPPTFPGSPRATADGEQCIGCHDVSGDGKTMALTIGGSTAPDFALLDLSTLTMTVLDAAASAGVVSMSDPNYYNQFRSSGIATETTFGPRGDVMVTMYRTQFFLRGTDASLTNQGGIMPSWNEFRTDPFWSASGKLFAFTSFATPDIGTYNPDGLNGDMKRGGQIAISSATATGINDDAHVLVARENNITKYYPAISNDDALVAYDQSLCGVDPDVYTNLTTGAGVYGAQTCDGYDDSSASIWLTTPDGVRPVRLDSFNGPPASATANARPQWGPKTGVFRGQKVYWVAFSSRRPYGLQVNNGAPLTTRPQLWLGAVLIDGALATVDPSFAPVWLPNQNPTPAGSLPNQVPTGNHTPQWAAVAVPLPP